MHKSVTYMECLISLSGIKPTEEKIEVVRKHHSQKMSRSKDNSLEC